MSKRKADKKVDLVLEKLERGRKLLTAWGIHEGALPPGSPATLVLDTLAPFIGRDANVDLVIAEWLGGVVDEASAAKLLEWEARAGKDLKREIRRSLFRLEQKGIRMDRPEEPRPSFTLRADRAEPEAYIGPVDGEGGRMAWLLRREGGRISGLFSVIGDREGMILVDTGKMSPQNLAEALKDSEEKGVSRLVRAPWGYVDSLMFAAFKKAPPKPGNMRGEYLLDRAEMITRDEPEPPPPCPIREILAAGEASDPALLEQSAKIYEERAFGSWVVPHEVARPHLQAYVNLSGSGLVLSKETSTERITALMDSTLEDFAASEWRPVYVRRLEEMAYFFHLLGRPETAKIAYAVSLALADPQGRRLKDVSFLRALVFRAFLPLMAKSAQAAQTGSGSAGPASSETAEGASRILDPSKVREPGVPGAGQVQGPDSAGPSLIVRP